MPSTVHDMAEEAQLAAGCSAKGLVACLALDCHPLCGDFSATASRAGCEPVSRILCEGGALGARGGLGTESMASFEVRLAMAAMASFSTLLGSSSLSLREISHRACW